MLPRLLTALHLALLVGALTAGHAQAEWSPALAPLDPGLNLTSTLPLSPHQLALAGLVRLGPYQLDPKLPPGPPETTPKEQRQARLVVTMGSGMLASAPLHMGLMSFAACGVPKTSYVVGGLMAGIGLGLTIAGARRLAPREQRQPASPARRFGLVVLALATLTASELAMFAVSTSDMSCPDG